MIRRPPVQELVLGAQFDPIREFRAVHAVRFFEATKECYRWERIEEQPYCPDRFERFGDAATTSGDWPAPLPFAAMLRFWLYREDSKRLLQLQNSKLIYNCVEGGERYPRFETVFAEFESHLLEFREFAKRECDAAISPNQWEVTYIDFVPQGELWQSVGDWNRVLDGMFAAPPLVTELTMENRTAAWAFRIAGDRGRVHLNVGLVRQGERQGVQLEFVARGPAADLDSMRAGMRLGRRCANDLFLKIVSREALSAWGLENTGEAKT